MKLLWEQINRLFKGEWVELVDYEWDETEPEPKSGVVRVHSSDHREFERLILVNPPIHSALIFVGDLSIPSGMTISSNQN